MLNEGDVVMESINEYYDKHDIVAESVRTEIINQGKALLMLAGGDKKLADEMIKYFGDEFRRIINEFKALFKGAPTPEQLIWIAGVHMGEDPRNIAKRVKLQLES